MWWYVAVGVVCAYTGTSLVLLRFPHLLHKRKQLQFKCAHISHRGGAGERLENTISAFQHAVDHCRTDMLELDCQLTADGQVVIAHDEHLDRIAGVDRSIFEHVFEELPDIHPSLPLHFYKDFLCHADVADSGSRRIPLLRMVFEAFPNVAINLDVKMGTDLLIEKVDALIREFGREDMTAWGNFSHALCDKCFKQNPRIPLVFSLRRVVTTVLLFYTGLLPFVPLRESCFEVLMPSSVIRQTSLFKDLSWQRRFTVWLVDLLLIRPALFRHLRRRGIDVYLWVLNEETDFDRAFKSGADGVMTDFPTKLREYLDLHPNAGKMA